MDFIRAAIKACFYDYPRAFVARMIKDGEYDRYCSRIVDVTKWSEPAFTLSEQKLLNDIIQNNWMKRSLGGEIEESKMARVFFLLNHFSDDVLNDTPEPTVKFDNLLRWHDITLYVGENLLTCAYFAEKDGYTGYERQHFTWPDILPHDNKDLNRILNGGLSDVHAHLNATTDVFAENWVALMNHVAFSKKDRKAPVLVDFERSHKEGETDYWDEQDPLNLHQWGIVAAAIRVQLAAYLYMGGVFDRKRITDMVSDAGTCISKVVDILGDISTLTDDTLRMNDEKTLDYAINQKDLKNLSGGDLKSPYMLHFGERRLLYNYFRRYYDVDQEAMSLAPFVYLYVLIKSKFRREFVQTNSLLGFENFKEYQDEKKLFSKYHNPYIAYKYAVQTAIGKDGKDKLEARVDYGAVNALRQQDYVKTLFDGTEYFERGVADNLRVVVHFIKKKELKDGDKSYRHYTLRHSLHKQMGEVIHSAQQNPYAKEQNVPILVGIDAAGAELNCRPEVFAPYFRWARVKGLANMTYHAGEDFYDVIDGLRTIDETMLFMEYQRGCRIGHGLALGVNTINYYSNRHYLAIMPRQYMLDNCVWLANKAKQCGITLSQGMQQFIGDTTHKLLSEIGYGETTDLYYYWQSMLLRGDAVMEDEPLTFPAFRLASKCNDSLCVQARSYKQAIELHERYETDHIIRERGAKPCEFKYPRSMCDDVFQLQEAMMKEVEERGVYIECNPSSNLKIGPFERYEDLAITRFLGVKEPCKHHINVSINTDDRGVFSTSIHNEYSLIAIALIKARDEKGERIYTDGEVYSYIDKIIQNGQNQRFDEPNMRLY